MHINPQQYFVNAVHNDKFSYDSIYKFNLPLKWRV